MKTFLRVMNSSKKNQSGQMAIFIALLFQLLFVFFAMVINIGLLVHDKINLQNSVDLAAIYAAQKQAEILNVIAHTNYQIHQSWKLLAFRVRVLGDYGRWAHPSNEKDVSQQGAANPYNDEPDPVISSSYPIICIANPGWEQLDGNGVQLPYNLRENLCRTQVMNVPPINLANRVAAANFTGVYAALQPFVQQAINVFTRGCANLGPKNWNMAARWYAAFRIDMRDRKAMIRNLAENLKQNNFREISGGPVMEGVRKTLMANLTRSNREAIQQNEVIFKNFLADIDTKAWLPEIYIDPVLYYSESSTCPTINTVARILNLDWGGTLPISHAGGNFPYDPFGNLVTFVNEPVDDTNPLRTIWGVEKNPWYLAYVGLKVTTRPKQPFSPLGRGVEMVARAFAQPFGGKVGPWYGREWPAGQPTSTGAPVDKLAPGRSGVGFTPDPKSQVPNFSRYPGDWMGMTSKKAMAMMRKFREPPLYQYVSPADYEYVPSEPLSVTGDVLAFNPYSGVYPDARGFELTAIAPNFFDVMYYSIEPELVQNYNVRYLSGGYFPPGQIVRQDLGGRNDRPDVFSVMRQVEQYVTFSNGLIGQPNFYEWQVNTVPGQLLTSWAPEAIVNYAFPFQFAACDMDLNNFPEFYTPGGNQPPVPVPGRCLSGGRVGYSVKVVSRDFLKSSELEFGGPGIKGPIKNAPPDDF